MSELRGGDVRAAAAVEVDNRNDLLLKGLHHPRAPVLHYPRLLALHAGE